MKTKITLTINAKRYDIGVEDDFAQFLIEQMKQDFDFHGNNDLKLLLQAYVRKNLILYQQEKQIDTLIDQIQTL
ncbi:hypothetical protein [Sulfuricurvum sp.]|uniref:hypothetical protein n=1 Tax=Sulfuricurvum sp. TaxID=2025608 RepID=UPI00199FA523|nr:hypothetical protein [Sulfuricurvum sp.]MBD3799370.1 hypothetical protein [Campylobacterota bacterium]MBD3806303.1 hypothetical protein [Sulfuricurvum sp.]